MTATLLPMTLGEILDRTFQIYRTRFLIFLSIGAVPSLTMLVLKLLNSLWWVRSFQSR